MPDPVGDGDGDAGRGRTGWRFARVRGPIGVIGIIYESRPNVTADAGALCVRAANAAILRGGSESLNSSRVIADALRAGLKDAGLPEDAIQLVQTADRAAVGHMLSGLNGKLDVVVPRGGKSLVARVQDEARVPVIGHLEGLCHTYIHDKADPAKAEAIIVNAKLRRVGVCGSTETMLIDAAIAPALLPRLAKALEAAGCELRGDARARAIHPMTEATDAGLDDRISRADPVGRRGGRRRRRHGAHRALWLAAHREHRHGRCGGGGAFPCRGRQRHRDAQRLDAVCRWRRVRHGRRDRHRHGPAACARARGRRTADDLQIRRARHGADPA